MIIIRFSTKPRLRRVYLAHAGPTRFYHNDVLLGGAFLYADPSPGYVAWSNVDSAAPYDRLYHYVATMDAAEAWIRETHGL